MSGLSMCDGASFRAEIRQHFAGAISPRAERALRSHLADCPNCRDLYERHLVLAELDPKALSAEERIGRGLGVRPRAATLGWPLLASAATVCAALAVTGVFATRDRIVDGPVDREFSPRGVVDAKDEFVVYRIQAGASPERAPRRMRSDDELAFAYTNPSGFAYLLVFGVDSKNEVHWYHPEWSRADATPRAVHILKGADLHELPDAVAQKLEGSKLNLFAVFTNEPFTVRELEESLVKDESGNPALKLPGTLVRQWQIEVE